MEIEEVVEIEVEVQESGPQGDRGLSAYEVYLESGGTLTETEWLESLKGEQGPQGIQGEKGEPGETGPQGPQGPQGYTPVKLVDYWTEEDQNTIKSYCDTYISEQIGIVENGEY